MVCVEELVRLSHPENQHSVLQVLLLKLCHLLVHQESFREILKFELGLSFDLSVNLEENFKVPRHHIRKRVPISLHLLELIIYLLNLLLPLLLPVLIVHLFQLFNQVLQINRPLLPQLLDVGPLLQ